ncbi:hypothetical protein [Tumebacillus permanentifrigoris]|uniref:Uncharacterized protein n=1 Tax=Tumebacillus permanentifrigoris TaxID=378543 RepID=A0A316DBN2_9BACL|nr:hypothetical protein [Tumebacillus permanentifrigoris]PWK15547.1 hypothetical protein C7459_10384 [Tumebacillus permanentifrigoris]
MKKMIFAALLASMMLIPTMASAAPQDVVNKSQQSVVSPNAESYYVTVQQYYFDPTYAPFVIYYTDPFTGASGFLNKLYGFGNWVTYGGYVTKN